MLATCLILACLAYTNTGARLSLFSKLHGSVNSWQNRFVGIRSASTRGKLRLLMETPRVEVVSSEHSACVQKLLPRLRGVALRKVAAELVESNVTRLGDMLEDFEKIGLTREAVSAVLAKRPMGIRRLCKTTAELSEVVNELSSMGANVSALFCLQPKLIDFSIGRLKESVTYLGSHGIDATKFVDFVLNHPDSLTWRDDANFPIAVKLQRLGFNGKVINSVKNKFPEMDKASAVNVEVVSSFLQNYFNLSSGALGKVLVTFPLILGLNAEQNLVPKIDYFRSLDPSLEASLLRYPQLFGLSLHDNIQPTISYLEGIGVNVTHAIKKQPSILGLSLESNIIPTIEFLQSLGMYRVSRVITQLPQILSLSVSENLHPKVSFFESLGLQNVSGGLGKQLDSQPAVFTLSLEKNLIPRVKAFYSAGLIEKPGHDSNSTTKLRLHHLTMGSLSKTIKPRLAFVNLCCARDDRLRKKLTLRTLTGISDHEFASRFGATPDEYKSFRIQMSEMQMITELKQDWGLSVL